MSPGQLAITAIGILLGALALVVMAESVQRGRQIRQLSAELERLSISITIRERWG
jgi:hypothetical protein